LRERIAAASLDLTEACGLSPEPLFLLRYLRARDFKVAPAFDMVQATVKVRRNRGSSLVHENTCSHPLFPSQWRDEIGVSSLRAMTAEQVLGVKPGLVHQYMPQYHSGFDRQGRPTLIRQYSRFDMRELKSLTTIGALVRHHIWEQVHCDVLAAALPAVLTASSPSGAPLGRAREAVAGHRRDDRNRSRRRRRRGMKMRQVTRDFLALIRHIAEIDQNYVRLPPSDAAIATATATASHHLPQYPERLGSFFITNTPMVFNAVWKGIFAVVRSPHREQVQDLSLARGLGPQTSRRSTPPRSRHCTAAPARISRWLTSTTRSSCQENSLSRREEQAAGSPSRRPALPRPKTTRVSARSCF